MHTGRCHPASNTSDVVLKFECQRVPPGEVQPDNVGEFLKRVFVHAGGVDSCVPHDRVEVV